MGVAAARGGVKNVCRWPHVNSLGSLDVKLRVARDKREVLERLPLVSFQNKMDTKVCRAYTLINLGENQVRKALSPK